MTDEPKKPGKKKGQAKTGGRQKGTRNRNSLSVLGALDKANIPIIEFLVTDIQTLDPPQRIEHWYRLLSFCYPKLKEIEFIPPLPPASGVAAGTLPPKTPATEAERLSLIRGHVPRQPAAPGK